MEAKKIIEILENEMDKTSGKWVEIYEEKTFFESIIIILKEKGEKTNMEKIKVTKKEKEILKDIERRISEEIFCIAETILEEDTRKTKGKIRGIINKYIIKRFAREKRLQKYGLDLDVRLEMETEMKEATFNLGYK